MMCQIARVVILLTAYARDHGEAWPYVASLTELMRFIAADRNDMVGEAAAAAPSERVLEELARLGAMLQSALRVQTYRDRRNQLCDANDAVVAAAAFVRSLDPVVTPAKTLTSSADDTLAAGRRGSLVNDTTATAMCDCEWQIAEAVENGCKYHREMQDNGQEHFEWCPAVGGGGFVGSDCSSDTTVGAERVNAADAERPAAEEAAHGGARSKLENAQQLQKLRFRVGGGVSANDNGQPPWRVAVTMCAGDTGDAELVFTAVASSIKGARNEACRAAWDAFQHWGRDDASVTKASTCVETYHRALSPTIVHKPSGFEYVECAVHGYINIECRPVGTIDAFIWRFIGNLRGVYLHCDIIGRTRPQCGDVFKHFKAAVRRYDGNQFDEEFQSYCNLSTALELAGLFSDVCSRSDDRPAAYGEARRYGFVPRNQEQCTCASCVSVCCDQCYN